MTAEQRRDVSNVLTTFVVIFVLGVAVGAGIALAVFGGP